MYAVRRLNRRTSLICLLLFVLGDHITMANIFVRDSNIVINIILFLMYSFKEEILVLLSFTLYKVIYLVVSTV